MDFERFPDPAWKKLTAYLDLASRILLERTSRLFFVKLSKSWDEVNSITFQVPVDLADPQASYAIAHIIQDQVDSAFKRCLPDKVEFSY